jgi:hypothetical protein
MTSDSYVSVRLRGRPVEQLRRLARQLAAEADQDVSASDALAAAAAYALDHVGDVATRLPGESAREARPGAADSAPGRPHGTATESETNQ